MPEGLPVAKSKRLAVATLWSILHLLNHSVFISAPQGICTIFHFTTEETEAQGIMDLASVTQPIQGVEVLGV